MFIQTEPTPNPASLKFLPGREVMGGRTMAFESPEDGAASPLAAALFAVEGVRAVFYGPDFVTVTKTAQADWDELKPVILGAIMDHFVSGAPLFIAGVEGGDAGAEADIVYDAEAQGVVDEIKDLIETRVRPAVAADGGDIVFHRYVPETGAVFLALRGACAGCPSSTMTLKQGIENLLRHYVPEVKSVEAVM